jgi:hypothetical protein
VEILRCPFGQYPHKSRSGIRVGQPQINGIARDILDVTFESHHAAH